MKKALRRRGEKLPFLFRVEKVITLCFLQLTRNSIRGGVAIDFRVFLCRVRRRTSCESTIGRATLPNWIARIIFTEFIIAQGERKEDCTLGQNRDKDQYPVLKEEEKGRRGDIGSGGHGPPQPHVRRATRGAGRRLGLRASSSVPANKQQAALQRKSPTRQTRWVWQYCPLGLPSNQWQDA